MKVVINSCYGGFGLSYEGMLRYFELNGWKCYPVKNKDWELYTYWKIPKEEIKYQLTGKDWLNASEQDRLKSTDEYNLYTVDDRSIDRDDPTLIQTIEELGEKANGQFAELKIINIPDGISYKIEEYDGLESIHETHQIWS